MASVGSILEEKGHVVHRVGLGETVLAAVHRMVEHNIGSLLVVAQDGEPLGMVNERDCLRRIVLEGRQPRDTQVEAIMTVGLDTVSPDASVDRCMRMMTALRIRHLAVEDGDAIVGIVSIGDVVRAQILEHRSDIEMLTQYIQGRS